MKEVHFQVRPHDCDAFGHVNNAAYASIVQHAMAVSLTDFGLSKDWGREGDYFWDLRSMSIEYRSVATFGDNLTVYLWLEEPDEIDPVVGFEIRRLDTGSGGQGQDAISGVRSVWNRVSRQTGEKTPVPSSLLADLPREGGCLPRHFSLPTDSPRFKSYHWDHRVMVSEVGPSGRIHPQAVYDWLMESVFGASEQAGWPTERRLAANFVTFQTRHDTEFLTMPETGDFIRITSRAIEVRRLRGTWFHEVRRLPNEELLVRDYSTGVYLDLSGRPATPPSEMMNAIQFGEY